jgi:hypothetical protein
MSTGINELRAVYNDAVLKAQVEKERADADAAAHQFRLLYRAAAYTAPLCVVAAGLYFFFR